MCVYVCVCVCVCVLCVLCVLCASPTQHFLVGFKGDLATQVIKKLKKGSGTTGREAPSSTALASVDDDETEGGGDDDPEEEEEEEITPDPDDGLPRVKDIELVRFF